MNDEATASQPAVDGEIPHRGIAHAPFAVEPEPNGPDLADIASSMSPMEPVTVGARADAQMA